MEVYHLMKIYQLTRKEAQARDITDEWDAFWKRVEDCSRALTNQNCSPPSMKLTLHRLAAQVGGVETIACLLAGELARRGPKDCMLGDVYEWAASGEYKYAKQLSAECGLLSFTLATTAKYVMTLTGMSPVQRLTEKMRVELGCFSGQLPWDDRERLMDCAGELAVKRALLKAVSQLAPDDGAVAYLLGQENTLDGFYSAYLKRMPTVENQVEDLLRCCSADHKEFAGDMLNFSGSWGERHGA